jgi:hypothetical protein
MKRLLIPIAASACLLALSSCCSNSKPRFWQVRDGANGATAYTVDTAEVPVGSLGAQDAKYVNASGQYVSVSNPKTVRELTETQWTAATSGARFSLLYCTHCKGCWAKVKKH